MTVTIKQREPDKDTHEQHIYIKYNVVMVTTAHCGYAGICIRVVNESGQRATYPLDRFDIEIH